MVFAFFPVALRNRTGGTENYKSADYLASDLVDMVLYTLASFCPLLFDRFGHLDPLFLKSSSFTWICIEPSCIAIHSST